MERSPETRWQLPFTVGLVLLALCQAITSYRALRELEAPGNYDTAYYFCVGRNLATGRGLTDRMVWHYLGPLAPPGRPAGDYWMVGWPIVLGALMTVFGHSSRDAFRICAGLSIFLPLLACRISWRLRASPGLALLTGFLVCAQTRLNQSNVTTDVTLIYQLIVLLGLGLAPAILRGEGTRADWCVKGMTLALPIWLRSMDELYIVKSDPSVTAWRSQGFRQILAERVHCARVLTYQLLIQIAWPLLLMAATGMIAGCRQRRVGILCLSLFLLLSAVVPTLLVPFGTNPDRLVMHALPILCILAASAVGDLNEWTQASRRWLRALFLAPTALLIVACFLVRARLNASGHFEEGWKNQFRPLPMSLHLAARKLGLGPTEIIVTQDPWKLAAVLDVPTVMIPYDGPEALRQVVALYQPRFVLLPTPTSKDANPKIVAGAASDRVVLDDLGFRDVLHTFDGHWYECPNSPHGKAPR